MGGARIRVLAFALVSLTGWTIYLAYQPRQSPLADLRRGFFTDHFSHMNAARAFVFRGVNLWKVPLAKALPRLTADQRLRLDEDIQGVAGGPDSESYALGVGPATKPIVASWSKYVRPYPPGDLLAVLPVALLYQFTDMSFASACWGLVWLFLLYAHIAFVLFATLPLEPRPAPLVALGILYLESVHWALNGFYDPVALIPLAIMVGAILRRTWLVALLAFCFAVFFHYRALFFAPLSLGFVVLQLHHQPLRSLGRRDWMDLALAVVLASITLITFFWVRPQLGSFPTYGLHDAGTEARRVFMFTVALLAVAFAWSRAWMDVALCLWVGVMVLQLRQAYEWHVLLLLPWMFLGKPEERAVRRDLRFAAVFAFGFLGLANVLLPTWLPMLW